jgi:hypothetical protein
MASISRGSCYISRNSGALSGGRDGGGTSGCVKHAGLVPGQVEQRTALCTALEYLEYSNLRKTPPHRHERVPLRCAASAMPIAVRKALLLPDTRALLLLIPYKE